MLGSRAARRIEVIGRDRIVSERLSAKAPVRHFDFQLFIAMLGLSVVGVAAVYSSTQARAALNGDDPGLLMRRQLIYLAVAGVIFIGTLLFDYRQLRGLSPVLYAGAILLLILVLTPLGRTVSGAQRWIGLGFFQIQPSEIAKLASIILLAALFSEDRAESLPDARLPTALGLTLFPALLIFVQPDLGTLLVLPAVLFAMLLVAGIKVRWLILMILGGIIAFVLILNLGLIREYQLDRLTAFMDPRSDPQRAGYNLDQSKIAVGSGGMTGKGYLKGSQTNLDYVPEQHTDFIFTAIAEEKGFVGAMTVLGLFALLLWRTLRIAMLSRDPFGTLLAAGIAAMISFQLFVNIGMTVGIMPITGIPLPFVSYGGSSLITNYAAVGILMNIHMRRFL